MSTPQSSCSCCGFFHSSASAEEREALNQPNLLMSPSGISTGIFVQVKNSGVLVSEVAPCVFKFNPQTKQFNCEIQKKNGKSSQLSFTARDVLTVESGRGSADGIVPVDVADDELLYLTVAGKGQLYIKTSIDERYYSWRFV
jgi:hypothetical protein